MTDEEFTSLERAAKAFENAQMVCDPIDYLSRQRNLLYAVGNHLNFLWKKEQERRSPVEDAE